MNRLAKELAQGLQVQLEMRVQAMKRLKDGIQLTLETRSGQRIESKTVYSAVLVTAPVPQALELLDSSAIELGFAARKAP